jgi:peroxiredoxin
MLELGTQAPAFALPDVLAADRIVSNEDAHSSALLVLFLCNHCPYVKHVEAGIAQLANDEGGRGLFVVGICSNDIERSPGDGPDGMREQADRAGFSFPYLYDESQEVARAFTAACTPDVFLFDRQHRLAYRGQLDASRPGNDVPVSCDDLRAAIADVLADRPVQGDQRPATGCGIKWRDNG